MKRLTLALVSAAALFAVTAAPAMAQIGVYAGPGGAGLGFGPPAPYYHGGYPYGGYYDYYAGPAWVDHPGWHWHHHFHHWRH